MAGTSNSPSLLLPKLQRPALPRDGVTRPRLLKALSHILDYPLTLVSAPTGFGKSTLVAQTLADIDAPCAWLNIDEYDNDLIRFLDYLIAAIHTQFPDACSSTQRLLGAVPPPPVEYLTSSFLNDLQAIPTPFVVVLDDFHHLVDPAIGMVFATLLRALPTSLHLMVITQVDPPWPLAHLIGRGQLLEIRAADLRFRLDEAQRFLETATGAALSTQTVTSLVEQTEGWIVALRLAALTLTNESGAGGGLSVLLAQEDRLAPRYLVQVVLARQSPQVREFLLRTSILERLSASLCAALMAPLTEEEGAGPSAQRIAAWLRDTNLFITPLGESGLWYRYHHLFRDLLRHELLREWPSEGLARLHGRASDWYAEHGLVEEALRHALAAGHNQRAVDIVEYQVHIQLNHENWRGVEGWLALLPDAMIRERPGLLMAQASIAGMRFDSRSILPLIAAAEARLADLETELSEVQRKEAWADVAAIQAYLLWWGESQAEAAVERARKALAGLPRDHAFTRGTCVTVIGGALYASGQREESLALLRRAVDDPSELVAFRARAILILGLIYRLAGPLFEREHSLQRHAQLVEAHDLPVGRLWAHYLLGSLHYERNELEEAREQLEMVAEGRYLAHLSCTRQCLFELALTYQAQGRARQADATARSLAQFCLERSGEYQMDSLALQVRLALARQDMDKALRDAVHLPTVTSAMAMFQTEVVAITRAQALLAGRRVSDRAAALEQLAALGAVAEGSGAWRPLVRILALQAIGLTEVGQEEVALARLERAVVLAEPLGLIRTFVDVGPRLAPLLRRVLERGVAPAYLRQVLAAFAAEIPTSRVEVLMKQGELFEPLTEREMEVLHLLEARLSTKEIAEKLVISPSTAKAHVLRIMSKLGSHQRHEAVQRAQALGLLPPR